MVLFSQILTSWDFTLTLTGSRSGSSRSPCRRAGSGHGLATAGGHGFSRPARDMRPKTCSIRWLFGWGGRFDQAFLIFCDWVQCFMAHLAQSAGLFPWLPLGLEPGKGAQPGLLGLMRSRFFAFYGGIDHFLSSNSAREVKQIQTPFEAEPSVFAFKRKKKLALWSLGGVLSRIYPYYNESEMVQMPRCGISQAPHLKDFFRGLVFATMSDAKGLVAFSDVVIGKYIGRLEGPIILELQKRLCVCPERLSTQQGLI